MERTELSRLDPADRELVEAARTATRQSYAPYSGFHVGAALRTADGAIVTGANVENAAYGSTICAERVAVGRANAEGQRAFPAVAIAARGAMVDPDSPVAPCGACRQVLMEMARATNTRTRVLMGAPESDAVTVAELDELLPLSFGPRSRPAP